MTGRRVAIEGERLPAYRCRDLWREMTVEELMRRFRDAERFIALCRECPRFGATWACPPFDYDTGAWLRRWKRATLAAVVIEVTDIEVPERFARPLMLECRPYAEKLLGKIAERYEGESVTLGMFGGCDRCGEGGCNRPRGIPCRMSGKIYPSLEALGFDVGAIMKELFGLPLQWPADGLLPPRLAMVTAVLAR